MFNHLAITLVFIGLLIQIATLFPLRKLMALIPSGTLRNKWLAMSRLIIGFIAGYLAYIAMLWGQQTEWHDLPLAVIFLFGAVFVWLAIKLSLQTAIDLLRIAQLESENITDALTKVYNRRYLDRRLNEEASRAIRYALPLSVLMLDIDHFKQVNDNYGHQAGDVALAALCRLLQGYLRDLDVFARYGGEEFLVICTNTAIDGAAIVAERIRHLVESNPVEISDHSGAIQSIKISVSIGVASLSTDLDTREKLLQAADQALYQAKQGGRNCVMVAPLKQSSGSPLPISAN